MIGRITKEPEVRYTQAQMAVCKFSIAINRGKNKEGKDMGADFPNVTVFGKQAENLERYVGKGDIIGVSGRIKTGSYEDKDGKKIYTTEIVADRIDFMGGKKENSEIDKLEKPGDFEELDEDVPF